MRRRSFTKLFNIIAIFLLTFSLFSPVSLLGEANSSTKNDHLEKVNTFKEIINKQDSKLKKQGEISPSLLRKVNTTKSNEKTRVIVQLSEAPVSLELAKSQFQRRVLNKSQIERKIDNQQKRIQSQLASEKVNYTLKNTFDRTVNALVLEVDLADVPAIANLPGVVRIELDEKVHALEINDSDRVGALMDNSNNHLGLPSIWDSGNKGKGIKVGIVDTGIDYEHPDLKELYKGGKNFVDHNASEEIKYNGVRDDDDPYETTPGEKPDDMPEFHPETGSPFYTSHGTHVAGIVAGQGKNEYGIKGVAPEVDLYAYRALGAYGSGMTSWVIAGIEEAAKDGVDIINLSLGGGSNHEDDATNVAVNNATLEGIVVVSATGNSGPGLGSISAPATAPLGIAVGNSVLPEVEYSAEVNVEAGDYGNSSEIKLMAWEYGKDLEEVLSGEFDLVAVEGWGEPEDYETLDVEGKVALVSRGETPFVDKIEAAKDAGAVAVLIHNNVDTGPADVFLGDSFLWIPSFDMATEEGLALREALTENQGKVSFSKVTADVSEGDLLNSSSSRGPSIPNYDIKPDVVAPGTNIIATVPAYGKEDPNANYSVAYDRKTGTSMATPNVAGIVALLLAENPNWDPYDVKVALSNTAKPLNDGYHVFDQGAGLVQPEKAINPTVLAYAKDTRIIDGAEVRNDKGTVTFGVVEPLDDPRTVTKEIVLSHLTGGSESFDVNVKYLTQASGTEVTVNKDSFTVNGQETIEVTLSVGAASEISGSETYGFIELTSGSSEISLPFAAVFEDSFRGFLQNLSLDEPAISLSGKEGVLSETKFNFSLFDPALILQVLLWDAENPEGGPDEDGYIGGLIAVESVMPGNYYIEIDGSYIDLESEEEIYAADGVYTIDAMALSFAGEIDGDWVPFYVKSSETEFEIGVENESLTNLDTIDVRVNDDFINFKETVDQVLGIPYDVNGKLAITYSILDEDGSTVSEQTLVELTDEGDFQVALDGLADGTYTLLLNAVDIAGNTSEEAIEFDLLSEEEFELFLNQSPTTETEDPVTITIDSNSEVDLTSVKWLAGEKSVEDFAQAGTEVDLDTLSFEVEENGTYTVYAKNEHKVETRATITVDNIKEKEEPSEPKELTIELTETANQDQREVTITLEVDSDSDLVSAKYLKGKVKEADFAKAGKEIDLTEGQFTVDENDYYTVLVENSEGERAIASIAVLSIKDPEQGNVAAKVTHKEPTVDEEGNETVEVTIEDLQVEGEIESLRWLEGAKSISDFEGTDSEEISAFSSNSLQGEEIDPETLSFTVDKNGIYTIYVRDTDGERGVFLLAVEAFEEAEDEEEGTDPEGEGDGDEGDEGEGEEEEENTDPGGDDGDQEGTDPEVEEGDEEETETDDETDETTDEDDTDKTDAKDQVEDTDKTDDTDGDKLPKTATPWYNVMLLGFILLVTGTIIYFTRKLENKLYE